MSPAGSRFSGKTWVRMSTLGDDSAVHTDVIDIDVQVDLTVLLVTAHRIPHRNLIKNGGTPVPASSRLFLLTIKVDHLVRPTVIQIPTLNLDLNLAGHLLTNPITIEIQNPSSSSPTSSPPTPHLRLCRRRLLLRSKRPAIPTRLS